MAVSLFCQGFLRAHHNAWEKATIHPFLVRCANASILPAQFNTWLVQDYHFAHYFVRLLSRTLLAAPFDDFEVLLGGMAAMKDELQWFKRKTTERGMSRHACKPQPACLDYRTLMEGLSEEPYPVLAAAIWAIEFCYHEAWRRHQPMKAPYDEFAARWGSAEFGAYVTMLEIQADEALADAGPEIRARAEQVCLKILRAEVAFWNMAFSEIPLPRK